MILLPDVLLFYMCCVCMHVCVVSADSTFQNRPKLYTTMKQMVLRSKVRFLTTKISISLAPKKIISSDYIME